MKKKIRYFIIFIIIFIIGAIIPGTFTRAKYYTNITMQSDLDIGYMVFNIAQKDEEPEIYEMEKGEEIFAYYKLTNKDINNFINKLDLKYYIKIVDENDVEQSNFEIILDDYSYLQYNIDNNGNIIDENGNIVDLDGHIIEERELTEEEWQGQLDTIKKGYGPIELSYDGETLSEIELALIINCPENYIGNSNVNLKIKVIAEGISNPNFTYSEEADLKINIVEEVNNENTNLINNINNNVPNNVNEMMQNINKSNIDTNEIISNSVDNTESNLNELMENKTTNEGDHNEENTEELSNSISEEENKSSDENVEVNDSQDIIENQNTNEIV